MSAKTPDTAYAFNTDKDIPDLAIEVVFSGETPRRRKTQGNAHQESSGGINDLQKYQSIGVTEVWFWKDNQITFYQLVDKDYQEVSLSVNLSNLSSELLAEFTNRSFSESPLIIKRNFLQQL